ncbi:SDR family NAD(P)-dependent oxidoreductase [Pararobbsia alpina]|uniref:A-factor type gamma-butyrolactone 1'-reductase (1S-forming) n=1 Tax=Pararobbsia alpina TaxID=621374 RepID=A0A6S7BJJ3_9BURK|nr:glucose 1-dehydrogenase [Pararobbsia alpina]CAB3802616.1 A-factor type gamma-butyrolactone 1'-reductase (1S-forming) [Pararobbsia alpina]
MTVNTVLITGALSGIGRATALAFARDGARIVVSGRREEPGLALVKELVALGAEAAFFRADVRHEADVERLVTFTVERFGRIDAAINNAGTEGVRAAFTEVTAENYAETFDTNVLGVLMSMKHELRVMVKQGGGSIVNLSSVAGKVGFPNSAIYAASKHAVEGLTQTAALEFAAQGIRVNAVAPGPVETPMLERFIAGNAEAKAGFFASIPARRGGQPDEIAQMIVFLASDHARYLTGQSIAVDGGYTAQ